MGDSGGRNLGGQPGNRQDNRQRGNAAQLLEKYKSMARDSQLAGDRVQTEYYLQFADHYFRVLGESRSRFEEQNPRRQRDDDLDDEMDGDEEMADGGEDTVADERPERQDRDDRAERNERFNRRDRPRRERPRRARRAARQRAIEPRHVNGGGETIPFDVLPPAIGRDEPRERRSRGRRAAPSAPPHARRRARPRATTRSRRLLKP